MLLTKVYTVRRTSEMFDLSNYGDYDRWLHAFADASARLDALETADLRGVSKLRLRAGTADIVDQ
jgi:hypothetical protein